MVFEMQHRSSTGNPSINTALVVLFESSANNLISNVVACGEVG